MTDYSPHQRKIINRYYKNLDAIKHQQLSELATELYLSEGKKTDRLWKRVEGSLGSSSSPSRESPTCLPSAIPRCWWEFSANLKGDLPRNREDRSGRNQKRNHADQCNSVAPGCCEPKSSSMTEGENPLATFFFIAVRHPSPP